VSNVCSVIVPVVAAVCCAAVPLQPMTFTTLDRGVHSNIESRREVVARTAAEWAAFWKEHAINAKPPVVDFTKSMVVGIFLGYRPTGGHSVEITRIERQGNELVVTYRERQPGKSDIVTQVITMPYHLVTVDRFDGPVRFVRDQ
jgi:hypothetical protein